MLTSNFYKWIAFHCNGDGSVEPKMVDLGYRQAEWSNTPDWLLSGSCYSRACSNTNFNYDSTNYSTVSGISTVSTTKAFITEGQSMYIEFTCTFQNSSGSDKTINSIAIVSPKTSAYEYLIVAETLDEPVVLANNTSYTRKIIVKIH